VGDAHLDTRKAGQERAFPQRWRKATRPPEDLLRLREEKDALPRAGFSSEKAVGE
jgi:hypothetical protein